MHNPSTSKLSRRRKSFVTSVGHVSYSDNLSACISYRVEAITTPRAAERLSRRMHSFTALISDGKSPVQLQALSDDSGWRPPRFRFHQSGQQKAIDLMLMVSGVGEAFAFGSQLPAAKSATIQPLETMVTSQRKTRSLPPNESDCWNKFFRACSRLFCFISARQISSGFERVKRATKLLSRQI